MNRAFLQAEKMAQEHVDDAGPKFLMGLHPEAVARDVAQEFGSGRVMRHFNDKLFGIYSGRNADGTKFGRSTKELQGTITGKAPSIILPADVSTDALGTSGRVAATRFTPRAIARNFTGSDAQAKVLTDRLALRNDPDGQNDAAVYYTTPIENDLDNPWTFYRSLNDGFTEHEGLKGYANPLARALFMNAATDHSYRRPHGPSQFGLNVGEHEAIHTLLHGQVPSRAHQYRTRKLELPFDVKGVEARPAVADLRRSLIDPVRSPQAHYIAGDSDEMGNLLWHTKRHTEAIEPGMRDVGENMGTLDNWMDYVRNYKPTGVDPEITMPGHPRQGQKAHGFESQIKSLQEILNAAGPDALEDIRDINFKTGQASPIRTALLS
jgi:hypothetical protein